MIEYVREKYGRDAVAQIVTFGTMGAKSVVRDVGQAPIAGIAPPQLPPNRQWTTVQFTDLRFAYSYLGMGRASGRSPLGGSVYMVDGRDDAGEAMGGREQH